MAEIELVMPMAGAGQRFREKGFTTPKPLVRWQGKPLFLHALDSVAGIMDRCRLTIVVSREDEIQDELLRELSTQGYTVPLRVVKIEGRTRGPAATVFAGIQDAEPESALLSLDCDLAFTSASFEYGILNGDLESAGALCSFKSRLPKFSYLRAAGPRVLEVREKQVISDQAILGAYFFRRAGDFRQAFEDTLLKSNAGEEIYVSHIIQTLLSLGRPFDWHPSDTYRSLGTPEDLA